MSAGGGQKCLFPFLPNEVLSQILLDTCLEAADLFRLSLVNKRFSQAVQQKLYGRIDLTLKQPTVLEQLLWSLRENAQLSRLVHQLRLKPPLGFRLVYMPDRINLAFEQILRLHLPALESLHCEIDEININVYEVNPILPVQRIRMSRTSLEQATMLMLLPNIERISIGYIHDTVGIRFSRVAPSVSSSLAGRGSRFSTAKHIRIQTGFDPHAALSPFVDWPIELKSFHGSLTVVGHLSPSSVGLYLEPAQDTLVDLYMGADTDDYTAVDGTFIYFEKFKCLARLSTTASLLFGYGWDRNTPERDGLYRRLPATLHTLEVVCNKRCNTCHKKG